MDSSSLFKFTEGEVETENIIIMAQRKFLMAYLKITSLGSPDLRVEGKADALVAISSTIMRRSVRMADTSLDEDNNHSRDIFNDQRNDR